MCKIFAILAAAVIFTHAARTEPYQSPVECNYELHHLANEYYVLLGYTYAINGYKEDSDRAFLQVQTYPHETAEIEAYLRELRKKGDGFKTLESENSYLLGRIQSKLSEYDAKLSDCLKNNKKIKKHLRDLQEQQVKNLFLLEK